MLVSRRTLLLRVIARRRLLLLAMRRLRRDDVVSRRRVTVQLVEHQRNLALASLDLAAQLCDHSQDVNTEGEVT